MSETDTPTPRTDDAEMTIAEVRCFLPDTAKVVSPDFARQLERELSRALKLAEDNGKLAHQTACELVEARKSAIYTHGRTTASAQGWALMYEAAINQRDEAREQRDTVADALERIIQEDGRPMSMRVCSAKSLAESALAAVKGGTP